MNKSMSRVKKFLGSPQNLESTHSNSVNPKIIESVFKPPTLPDLLCQNQDLKQRVSRLQKQKQQLQKSVQNLSIQKSFKKKYASFQIDDSRRVSKSRHKQSYSADRSSHSPNSNLNKTEYLSPQKVEKLSPVTLQGNNKSYMAQYHILKDNNRKLKQKVNYLERILEHHQKQKKQMSTIIDSLCKKLQQSTKYINQTQKMPNPSEHEHYIRILEDKIRERYNINRQILNNEGFNLNVRNKNYQQEAQFLNIEIQNYKNKFHQFMQIKDQNYQLRDRIAKLIMLNAMLKQKVVCGSTAVEHLWKIKEVQLNNLNQCIKQMKSS